MESLSLNTIELLSCWIKKKAFTGFDPYDIKGHRLVIGIIKKSGSSKFFVYLREIIFEFFYAFPIISRKLFQIKPQANAKAMGLFAKAYLDLFISTGNKQYLNDSKACIDWLDNNNSELGTGKKWGYPFDWQSTDFIPKNTPNGIVTTAVADAYWSWYKYTGEKKYFDVCIGICHFLETLPIDILDSDKICFSYTPLFTNHVHNLNLFVAEFLIKMGYETKNQTWIELGNKAINYTLADQNTDGSFDYNGPPEKPQNFIDNYHTGFVLRMLHSIWKITQRNDVYNALEKGYHFYLNNFFENNTIPWLKPNQKYRIDIHSCAESINCLTDLSETFDKGIETAKNVLDWTIKNLQDKTGYFYYGINKNRFLKFTYTSKIAYMRWSQAWMLKALSNYYKNQSHK
jgi:hypothetical protein